MSCTGNRRHIERTNPISRPALVAIPKFLLRDCSICEEEAQAAVTRSGKRDEQRYIRGLTVGPSKELLEEVDDASRGLYKAAKQWTQSGISVKCLTMEQIQAWAQIPQRTHLERTRESFIRNYRSRAILALGLIRSRAALPQLRAIANDARSPLRRAAQDAIRAIGR